MILQPELEVQGGRGVRHAGGHGIEGLVMTMSLMTFFLGSRVLLRIGDMIKRCIVWVYEMGGCSGEEERVSQEYFLVND